MNNQNLIKYDEYLWGKVYFQAISWWSRTGQYHGDREQVTSWWDDDDVHIVLDKNM